MDVGKSDGAAEGAMVTLGESVGVADGGCVPVGAEEGEGVGDADGAPVGPCVGASVHCKPNSSQNSFVSSKIPLQMSPTSFKFPQPSLPAPEKV